MELASPPTDISQAASSLLQSVLLSIPSDLLSAHVRAEIDRTLILTSDKGAMLASVLNPVPAVKGKGAGASIIPFLARGYSDAVEVEALIRPRMPVIMTAPELDADADAEEDDEDEDMENAAYEPASETTSFLKFPAAGAESKKTEPIVASSMTVPVQKRTYIEESAIRTPGLASVSDQQSVQAKKARTQENDSIDSQSDRPATITQVITSSSHPVPVVQQQTHVTSESSAAPQAVLPEDESDDELPTLNIDPDTDDDEEDDDVPMEG